MYVWLKLVFGSRDFSNQVEFYCHLFCNSIILTARQRTFTEIKISSFTPYQVLNFKFHPKIDLNHMYITVSLLMLTLTHQNNTDATHSTKDSRLHVIASCVVTK